MFRKRFNVTTVNCNYTVMKCTVMETQLLTEYHFFIPSSRWPSCQEVWVNSELIKRNKHSAGFLQACWLFFWLVKLFKRLSTERKIPSEPFVNTHFRKSVCITASRQQKGTVWGESTKRLKGSSCRHQFSRRALLSHCLTLWDLKQSIWGNNERNNNEGFSPPTLHFPSVRPQQCPPLTVAHLPELSYFPWL